MSLAPDDQSRAVLPIPVAPWKEARAPRGAPPWTSATFEEALMYHEVIGTDVHGERGARRYPW
jgi:hypothetical protein